MTVKGGSSPACAACKYQRRKCSSDCVLAPYFPANQNKVFQNVHRLYGVSKVMHLLNKMATNEQKEDCMKSVKYESEMRARFPVHGCLTIIYQLRQQLQQGLQELHYVHHQLQMYKTYHNNNGVDNDEFGASGDEPMSLMMMNTNTNNYSYEFDNNNNNGSMFQPPSVNLEEVDATQEYQDIFFNPLGDDNSHQSYCESSSGSSMKDLNDKSESNGDLKCAAASFSLISIK